MEQQLYLKLNSLSIGYEILEHKPILTMDDGREIMAKLNGCVPINLALIDSNGKYYLLVKKITTKLKINDLNKKLSVKGIKMLTQEKMSEILGVPPGCATIFSLINYPSLHIIIDDTIKDEFINFHPMRNNATMTIKYQDVLKFIGSFGTSYTVLTL